jgi:hypothetical protein
VVDNEARYWLVTAMNDALDEARWLAGFLKRFGCLKPGRRRTANDDMRFHALTELMLDSARDPRERKLPDDAREYLLRLLEQSTLPPERGRPSTEGRADLIVKIVARLVAWYGLTPTRNRERIGDRRPTACEIVAVALGEVGVNLDGSTVERLWSNRPGDFIDDLPVRIGLSSADIARIEERMGLDHLMARGVVGEN